VAQDQLRLHRVLRRRQGDVQNFFAGAAAEWDKIRTELYGDGFSNSACLALLDDRAAVADLGCGTGQIAEAISPFVRQVICVDDSPAMLKAARRRLNGASNVEIRRGELASVPIDKGSCDAALMILALTYVIDPQPVLAEMSRILKPGAKAVIVDLLKHDRDDFRRQMGQHWPGFETEQISIWLAEAGFRVHGIRSLAPEKNAKGPALWLASAIKLEANR
jgi:ArsR family transcriptional regulator